MAAQVGEQVRVAAALGLWVTPSRLDASRGPFCDTALLIVQLKKDDKLKFFQKSNGK
jgi:hypothetical protein